MSTNHDTVDMSAPVFRLPNGAAKYAVWRNGRVARYVTSVEADAEIRGGTLALGRHEHPLAGNKPNRLSGAMVVAAGRRRSPLMAGYDRRLDATHQARVAAYNAAILAGDDEQIQATSDILLLDIHRRIICDDRYVERSRGE